MRTNPRDRLRMLSSSSRPRSRRSSSPACSTSCRNRDRGPGTRARRTCRTRARMCGRWVCRPWPTASPRGWYRRRSRLEGRRRGCRSGTGRPSRSRRTRGVRSESTPRSRRRRLCTACTRIHPRGWLPSPMPPRRRFRLAISPGPNLFLANSSRRIRGSRLPVAYLRWRIRSSNARPRRHSPIRTPVPRRGSATDSSSTRRRRPSPPAPSSCAHSAESASSPRRCC